ncbi:MAG TPA: DUF99 family protein [Gammaproteobacteria bacterium]|nr:DUF99 family protein [Gammaproteobacteria bacterium]
MSTRLSHVIGFDDAPFHRAHRGDVLVAGAVFSGARLDGVLSGRVRRDGANATGVLAAMVERSRFAAQLQAVLVQGIALAGFNVVDIEALHRRLELPVIAVTRKQPDRDAVRRALLEHVPGGRRKWGIIERLGPMEPLAGLWVQRAGIDAATATALLERSALHGRLPEPLRTAHLIAGGIGAGESRHRP